MTQENDAVEAIRKAIQMEKDGYAFYKRAAAQTSSSMGKTVFESLAKDELIHLDTFQKIFEKRVGNDDWEVLVDSSKKYANLPVFPKDLVTVEGANPDTNELDALNMAMQAEKEAIEYYSKIFEKTEDPNVRQILEEIIQQEKNHYLILNEEFTHLSSQGHWYGLDVLGG